jgi:hypothetical protein
MRAQQIASNDQRLAYPLVSVAGRRRATARPANAEEKRAGDGCGNL